jgi:flagellar basal-body rod modification protein FlgD
MTVSGTGNTNNLAATQYTSKTTATADQVDNPNSALGKNDFLQMLVTKLANQDPLDAKMDESFMSDMAQFSSLEQMTSMNNGFGMTNASLQDLNTNIISLMLMQNTSQAASLIGKTVTVGYQEVDKVTNALVDKTLTGSVSVVRFVDGVPKIVVDGKEYQLSAVKEISA